MAAVDAKRATETAAVLNKKVRDLGGTGASSRAEITGAEISGHYEGSLTVRENLLIRSTGRVSGTVRYGKLHIEDGGEINGDVKSIASAKT